MVNSTKPTKVKQYKFYINFSKKMKRRKHSVRL